LNKAWTIVIEALSWVELKRINEDSALVRTVKQLGINEGRIIDEAKSLIYEVLMRRNALDYLIERSLAPEQLNELELGVRSFLRLYTYMFHYGESSFKEIYDLAGHARSLLGQKALEPVEEAIDIIPHIRIPWENLTRLEILAYMYYYPDWYIEYLGSFFDEEMVVNIIESVNIPKYIRVNTLKADENVLGLLYNQGFQLSKVPRLDDLYQVLGNPEEIVNKTPYMEGELLFQDKASALVGEVSSPKIDDVVLDICAAPGVKTSHLAQIMRNTGRIISIDYDKRRIGSWKKITGNLGVNNAEAVIADATKPTEIPDVEADIVLLDPPCTGTGTFNEYPSGKWRINENSIYRMANLQGKMIKNAANHVKDGGRLIYSTCSVTFHENEGVIIDFLERNPEFELSEATPRLGESGLGGLEETQRLYPFKHQCQGFFIAKIIKNK
jgi:16S rRNA (cytosine967-C5)-methyltransferase